MDDDTPNAMLHAERAYLSGGSRRYKHLICARRRLRRQICGNAARTICDAVCASAVSASYGEASVGDKAGSACAGAGFEASSNAAASGHISSGHGASWGRVAPRGDFAPGSHFEAGGHGAFI